ncbi:MAG: transcription elongation factor GreB [Pedosphaera sp.]|nr:transcription elongation factor GreB [Pedosphaera sp.]
MSKAFTREDDDAPEPPPLPSLRSLLPPGAKNYLTPAGARRLQVELDQLLQQRAPENKSPNHALDQRVLRLQQSLATAVITPAPPPPWEQVRFGATVTVRNAAGEESRYRIVGVDETDLDRDWVSWLSPIAKALLNARLGEKVRFKFPSGEEQLEIVAITFD